MGRREASSWQTNSMQWGASDNKGGGGGSVEAYKHSNAKVLS